MITVLNENLAPYAIPIFIRLKSNLATTHSLKLKKLNLKKESFDIENIDDPLYIKLPDKSEYIPLTKEIYEDIHNQKYNF